MSAQNPAPTGGVDALQQLDTARHAVIKAALRLAAVEWGNGRESADASADLDCAHDQFDTALDGYADAHVANTTVPVPFYPVIDPSTGNGTVPNEHINPREQLVNMLLVMEDIHDAYLIGDHGNELGYRTADGQEYRALVAPVAAIDVADLVE